MRLGLCLSGGGAKGAFQGGIIKRFNENNIEPYIITGTSIGAINAYFIMKNGFKDNEDFWINMDTNRYMGKVDRTIENDKMIDELKKLKGRNKYLKSVFVNYVHVENRSLNQRVVDITGMAADKAMDAVKFSSLLPARAEENNEKTMKAFDSQKLFEYFKEDVAKGIYDGYNLDGGILNNYLLSPFIENRVDKIVIIPLKNEYNVPEYILNYYKKEDVLVIEPDIKINPGDTVRFENEYCSEMFQRGYIASEIVVNKLKAACLTDSEQIC